MASVNRVFIEGVLGHTPQAHTGSMPALTVDGKPSGIRPSFTTTWLSTHQRNFLKETAFTCGAT